MIVSTPRAFAVAALSCALLVPVASLATPTLAAPVESTTHTLGVAQNNTSPFTTAEVVRAGDNWKVTWSTRIASPVAVSFSADGGATWKRVARDVTSGTFSMPAQADVARPWFRLQSREGAPLEVTTRSLGLDSAKNLRDAGGYRTADGNWVRMGVLYRSNALTLSSADLDIVETLGIRDVYDLRMPREVEHAPDVVPAGAELHLLDMLGSSWPHFNPTTPEEARTLMEDLERWVATDEHPRAAVASLIEMVATERGAQLWNCSAGKDRTGWAAAVILSLLGVDERTVIEDYLLSNRYYYETPEVQAQIAALPKDERATWAEVHKVYAFYLQAGLDEVEKGYGSMYAYATEGLGISPATIVQLRARLLTAPTG